MIAVDVIDSEEADKDNFIDHNGTAFDEDYGSGLVGAGITEEVKDMQNSVKYSSLFSYMLKLSCLLTQGFEKNNTSQQKLFKQKQLRKLGIIMFAT